MGERPGRIRQRVSYVCHSLILIACLLTRDSRLLRSPLSLIPLTSHVGLRVLALSSPQHHTALTDVPDLGTIVTSSTALGTDANRPANRCALFSYLPSFSLFFSHLLCPLFSPIFLLFSVVAPSLAYTTSSLTIPFSPTGVAERWSHHARHRHRTPRGPGLLQSRGRSLILMFASFLLLVVACLLPAFPLSFVSFLSHRLPLCPAAFASLASPFRPFLGRNGNIPNNCDENDATSDAVRDFANSNAQWFEEFGA